MSSKLIKGLKRTLRNNQFKNQLHNVSITYYNIHNNV